MPKPKTPEPPPPDPTMMGEMPAPSYNAPSYPMASSTMPTDQSALTFLNDPSRYWSDDVKRTSSIFGSHFMRVSMLSPAMAAAVREYTDLQTIYLRFRNTRHRSDRKLDESSQSTFDANNLQLYSLLSTSSATRPESERKVLATQYSEVSAAPQPNRRKKFLGLM
jgi:hypothetical protein